MAFNSHAYSPPPPAEASTGIRPGVGTWSAGFAFVVALLALFASLQLFQLTAEGPAKQTLRRSLVTIAEIDPLLDRHFDDVQRSAQNAGAGDTVKLGGFPIDVPLAPGDVIGASKAQLRDVLLDRAADVMYAHGTDVLRPSGASDADAGRFSSGGLTRHGLGFLRSRNHDILAVTTSILAVLCAVLAITLASMCRGFGRLAGIGAAVVTASLPLLVGGISARVLMTIATAGDTEYVQREFLEIGQGLAWIAIRDGAAFATVGLLFLLAGIACANWADRRGAHDVLAARR